MGKRWRTGLVLALSAALAADSCATPSAAPGPTSPPQSALAPLEIPEYPTYPVGFRTLDLHRGPTRPLHTLVFYPASDTSLAAARPQRADDLFSPTDRDPAPDMARAGSTGTAPTGAIPPLTRIGRTAYPELVARLTAVAGPGLAPAPGRFPLVLFSHGLSGSAERYAPVLARIAAAGFVVAAPTYPNTSEFAPRFRRADIVRQPDDARFVLSRVLRLDHSPGDPLRHRIDADHIAAVGHSAGGYTTTGLFVAGHDRRLRAGVVMAGWQAPGAFAGPPATMLFLQGTADPVVPRTVSHAVWSRVPWSKAYVLLRGNSHATYLQPGDPGYPTMLALVTDFLRWTLRGDEAAGKRLPRMIKAPA